jgi:hypothetical protein
MTDINMEEADEEAGGELETEEDTGKDELGTLRELEVDLERLEQRVNGKMCPLL